MSLEEKLKQNIIEKKLINPGESVIIGFSGGSDSSCLLNAMNNLSKEMKFNIYAAHLNHMIRGNDAIKDSLFCYDFCKKNNIKLFLKVLDIPKISKERKKGIEDTARICRYEFFDEIKDKIKADKIAVAHNMEDQVETFFLNIFRGSSLDGLKSMNFESDRKIIRPILNVKKEEILNYLNENNLGYVTDETNNDVNYSRNKIRHDFIPYIEKEYSSNIKEIVFNNTININNDYNFLNDYSDKIFNDIFIKESDTVISINISKLIEHSVAVKNRIYRKAIESLNGSLNDFSYIHIANISNLADSISNHKTINLPQNINIFKKDNYLLFSKGELKYEKLNYEYELEEGKINIIKELNAKISLKVLSKEECIKLPTGKDIKAFDYDKIKFPLKVRNKRDGDKMNPIGLGGSKKISDIFIDNKIDKFERDKFPIFTDENGILWMYNYRISENYKIDDSTQKVLRISIKFNK